MSVFSLLLRCLLLVGLVANGAGAAQASARMQLAHVAHTAIPAPSLADEPLLAKSEGCHDQAASVGVSDVPTPHPGNGHVGSNEDGSAESPDCCGDGSTCHCPCAQHAPMAFNTALQLNALLIHASACIEGTSQHASPRLPHLIRPPIG